MSMLKYSWYEMDSENHQWNKIEFSVDDKGQVYFPKRDEIKLNGLVVLEDTDTENRFRIATDNLTPPVIVDAPIAEDNGWIVGPTVVTGTTPDGGFRWVGPGYSARKESQRTILEKVIERVDKMPDCKWGGEYLCGTCSEGCEPCDNRNMRDQVIKELKSLMGEA